jgi:hypothetical protein
MTDVPSHAFTMKGGANVMLVHINADETSMNESRWFAKTAMWPSAHLTITPEWIDLKMTRERYRFKKPGIIEVRMGVTFNARQTLLVRHDKGFLIETAHFWPTLTGRIKRTLDWRMAAIAWALEDCGYIEV